MSSLKMPFVAATLIAFSVLLFGISTVNADFVTPPAVYDNSPLATNSAPISGLIDGDSSNYVRLTNGGDEQTEPARGYVVFDLGSPQVISGFKYQACIVHPSLGPQDTDIFYWANEAVNAHQFTPNQLSSIASDPNVIVAASSTLPAAVNAGDWIEMDLSPSQAFTARYVGVRFASGYDTPARAGVFMAEAQINASPVPEPSAITVAVTGIVGMLAYAWRKRK